MFRLGDRVIRQDKPGTVIFVWGNWADVYSIQFDDGGVDFCLAEEIDYA